MNNTAVQAWLSEEYGDHAAEAFADRFANVRDDEECLVEALDVLAHIVSQANVNPVVATDKHGEYISRYDLPVGSIHKAIPFLARFGIVVDTYGVVHRSGSARHNRNLPPSDIGAELITGAEHAPSDSGSGS